MGWRLRASRKSSAIKHLSAPSNNAKDLTIVCWLGDMIDRKSTRLNSSHVRISYAVFCLKKKKLRHSERGAMVRQDARALVLVLLVLVRPAALDVAHEPAERAVLRVVQDVRNLAVQLVDA